MSSPKYRSDYHRIFVNGNVTHRLGLPGLDCPDCSPWAGSRILPFECPKSFCNHKNLIDGWPISPDAHRELCSSLLVAIREEGHSIESLEPGDRFQPAVLDIPTRPDVDFLWSGIGSVLVSERIKIAFESAGVSGVEFLPIHINRVGKARASDEVPIPSTGEPEDIIEETQEFFTQNDVDPYYEMIVTSTSSSPPGADVVAECSICGRESIDYTKRRLFMNPEMWRGQDVFFLDTTLWIIITEKVHSMLTEVDASNVSFLLMRAWSGRIG